ncbi:MAG TPA: glycerol-3-phosphate 1-O-acyltransferase PlsY [Bacillota bacterium]|nr:glycerol-3-phosphate 1-O-acyltransferase PlsY [Bacillota bacterium]
MTAVLIGYVLGSISFSYLIAKWKAGIDIREHGSGNAGATNTLRVLGRGPGILVLFLDAIKGIVAILIVSGLLHGDEAQLAAAGFGAILGHNWPVFFGFRGGKGVATTIGVMAVISFYPFLISVLITILIIYFTRYVSLGSLVFFILMPIIMYLKADPTAFVIMAILVGIIGIIRHSANIKRLIKGTESKLGQKK